MWIMYLVAIMIAVPLVAFLSLLAYVYLQRQREIRLAQTAKYAETDPLLRQIDPNQVALLYFTSDYCVPCKTMQRPAIEALKDQMPDLQVLTIDTLAEPEIARRWHVMSLPRTFVIGKNRHVHATNMSVASTALLQAQFEAALVATHNTIQVNLPEKHGFRLPKLSIKPGESANLTDMEEAKTG